MRHQEPFQQRLCQGKRAGPRRGSLKFDRELREKGHPGAKMMGAMTRKNSMGSWRISRGTLLRRSGTEG
jgi:hypothetical protein